MAGNRVCSKCGVEKPATLEFFDNYRDRGKLRQRAFCRDCLNARSRAYRAANPNKTREWDKRNQEKNRGAGSDYVKRKYARTDKAKAREALHRWKAENPDKVRVMEVARNERVKEQRRTDPTFREQCNKRARRWRERRKDDPAYREARNESSRKWHAKNKNRQNAYKRRLNAQRRKTDINFKIRNNIRRRINLALKEGKKGGRALTALGCSIDALRRHIEKQFLPGMTWDNWGRGWNGAREWHLDHIKPLSSFDLSDPEQFSIACHHTNLKPLWAADNIAKGAA